MCSSGLCQKFSANISITHKYTANKKKSKMEVPLTSSAWACLAVFLRIILPLVPLGAAVEKLENCKRCVLIPKGFNKYTLASGLSFKSIAFEALWLPLFLSVSLNNSPQHSTHPCRKLTICCGFLRLEGLQPDLINPLIFCNYLLQVTCCFNVGLLKGGKGLYNTNLLNNSEKSP